MLYYDYQVFIWILMVNTGITVLYLLFSLVWGSRSRRSCLLRGLMMLLCPVVGPAYIFLGWIFYVVFFHKPVDLEDVLFSKDKERMLLNAEEDKERNLVPVEDAMLINDRDDAQAVFLDVIRRNPQKTLYSISLALNSEDSELSHYAASIIQVELDKARKAIQERSDKVLALGKKLEKSEQDQSHLRTKAGYLFAKRLSAPSSEVEDDAFGRKEAVIDKQYYADIAPALEASADYARHKSLARRQGILARDGALAEQQSVLEELNEAMEAGHDLIARIDMLLQQNLLTEYESKRFVETLDQVARIVEKRDVLSDQELKVLVLQHLAVGDIPQATQWNDTAFSYYPLSVATHSAHIKLLYATGDREGFFQAVGEMKRSDLPLDAEMLELVRFFQT